MASLTARGRAAVVVAFFAAAALAAGAAVALVQASDHPRTLGSTLPRSEPTLIFPSETPTPTPTAIPLGTPTATPTPTATLSPTASPTPKPTATATRTTRPSASPTKAPAPLHATASVAEPTALRAGTAVHLAVRGTDGEAESIVLESVDWGDGSEPVGPFAGTGCTNTTVPAGGACRDFATTHTFSQAGTFTVVATVTSGPDSELVTVELTLDVQPATPS